MNRICLLVLLIILSCSTTQNDYPEYSAANNIKEYNKFVQDFEKNYIYLADRTELWQCIKDAYSEKVGLISNTTEHILFYENLLNEFYDSHIHPNKSTNQSYRLDAPIYVINENRKSYIKHIWQTQLRDTIQNNIIGAEIMTINNVDFQQKIEDFPTICQDKKDKNVREWIANRLIAGKRNEGRALGLKLKNGENFILNIDSLKIKEEEYLLSHSIIENNTIGLIRINNTLGDKSLAKEFEKVLPQMNETKALIIDLRNTVNGGNTAVAKPIMGMFINHKTAYQLYENHQKRYFGYVKPNKFYYDKPLYVLVNRWTGSMGEGIAIGLNSINGAKIVGTEMARLAGGMKKIKLKNHDYSFQVSYEKIFDVNGNPREKFVPIDYVEQTQIEKDEILEYAIEKIKNSDNNGHW